MNLNINKEKYFSLLSNIKNEKETTARLGDQTLIIDGLNTAIRSFMVLPTMNTEGQHIGAVTGFLKSIAFAIRMIKPKRCIVVFDGKGGSKRRREIYPEYKNKRKTRIRVNRMYTDMSTPDSEDDAMRTQLIRIVEYLKTLPITVISVDNIEADDVIAYITTHILKDERITIMSADKDFYQLIDDRVSVWSPTKKKMYTPAIIKNEYGITSNNFIYYRILDGDKSDNVDGIKGAGIKTIIKAFPLLTEEKTSSVEELYSISELNQSGLKIYKNIYENKEILERNFKLMQLKDVDIFGTIKLKLIDLLNQPKRTLDKYAFLKLSTEDKVGSALPNPHIWLHESFGLLDYNSKL